MFPAELPCTEDRRLHAFDFKETTKKIGMYTSRLAGGWIEANITSEHKGTNNRVTRDLGWVTVRGSRYTPRKRSEQKSGTRVASKHFTREARHGHDHPARWHFNTTEESSRGGDGPTSGFSCDGFWDPRSNTFLRPCLNLHPPRIS